MMASMPNGMTDFTVPLEVAKLVIEAPIASFRHPHFLIARQPTFDSPPPSTIYGLLATALADWPAPDTFRFAYSFRFRGRASDLEHQHVIYLQGGKLKTQDGVYPKVIEGDVQPHLRDFLFQCTLELYLAPASLGQAFLTPQFALSLGRSQDLATVTSVSTLSLQPSPKGYWEDTILPFSFRDRVPSSGTVLLPRFIEPPPQRNPHFERYINLRGKLFAGLTDSALVSPIHKLLPLQGKEERCLVDTQTPVVHGAHRALHFLTCSDADGQS